MGRTEFHEYSLLQSLMMKLYVQKYLEFSERLNTWRYFQPEQKKSGVGRQREMYDSSLYQKGVKKENMVNIELQSYWDSHVC